MALRKFLVSSIVEEKCLRVTFKVMACACARFQETIDDDHEVLKSGVQCQQWLLVVQLWIHRGFSGISEPFVNRKGGLNKRISIVHQMQAMYLFLLTSPTIRSSFFSDLSCKILLHAKTLQKNGLRYVKFVFHQLHSWYCNHSLLYVPGLAVLAVPK